MHQIIILGKEREIKPNTSKNHEFKKKRNVRNFKNETSFNNEELIDLLTNNYIYNFNNRFLMFDNLEIGSGSYGKVCFGLIKEPYKFTAIKIQNKEKVKKRII